MSPKPGLRPLSQAYEAIVERMLMSVILVKDQVEQSRFAVKPYLLRADEVAIVAPAPEEEVEMEAAQVSGPPAGFRSIQGLGCC